MLEAALLAVNKSNRLAPESLLLPGYPHLLPQVQYVIPLLGLLADAKPVMPQQARSLSFPLVAYIKHVTKKKHTVNIDR